MLNIDELNPDVLEAIKALHKIGIKPPAKSVEIQRVGTMPVVEYAHKHYYTPETGQLIKLEYWQQIWLRVVSGQHEYNRLKEFYPVAYFTGPKKIGKTATSGVYAQWRAASPILNDEILFFANDETQSRGRAYADIQKSIELNPLYDKQRRVLVDGDGNTVWRIIEDYIEHVPTSTKIRAVNVDYRGESGANPSLSVWTEVWGFDTDKQAKLVAEMTTVLTRSRSQQYFEGYAGYIGRSKVQEQIEALAIDPDKGARQLTLDDIPDWPWPDELALPMYVNDDAGVIAYVERGVTARKRMPWTQGPVADEYYRQQAIRLTPEQYLRLHENQWVSDVTAFIPIEWWQQCNEAALSVLPAWRLPTRDCVDWNDDAELEKYMDVNNWRIVGEAVPLVLGVDASVVGDCTAVIGVTRHPIRHMECTLRHGYVWTPPRGGKLDYELTTGSGGLSLKHQLIDLTLRYNVVEIAYDNWQLHHLMNELRNQGIAWCREFSQAAPRGVADKQLYDLIKGKKLVYNREHGAIAFKDLERHILGAARQQAPKEDTKMRIRKLADDSKIDMVIAMSMATAECLRLDL